MTENSTAVLHVSRRETQGQDVRLQPHSTCSVDAEVESSLGPGWCWSSGWLSVTPPPPFPHDPCPPSSISSKPAGSSVAPSGRRARPPDPAELPRGGGAALFRSSQLQLAAVSAVLRGVAAAAAVAGCIDFCLRCLPVRLPVADQQQSVQQVVVRTGDKEAAGSFLPDLQAGTGTEKNVNQAMHQPLGFLRLNCQTDSTNAFFSSRIRRIHVN